MTRENVPVAVAFAFAFTAASTDGRKAANAKGMYPAAENFGQGCKQLRAKPSSCLHKTKWCHMSHQRNAASWFVFNFRFVACYTKCFSFDSANNAICGHARPRTCATNHGNRKMQHSSWFKFCLSAWGLAIESWMA